MTETQALRDGKLVHTEILEPEKYGQFTFVDTSSKNTTKWKLAKEQNGAESTYTLKEKYMASRIAAAFLQNDACVSFMKGAKTEEPALVEVDGLAVRGKADIFKEGEYVADVKTTNDGLERRRAKEWRRSVISLNLLYPNMTMTYRLTYILSYIMYLISIG